MSSPLLSPKIPPHLPRLPQSLVQQRDYRTDIRAGFEPCKEAEGTIGLAWIDARLCRAIHELGRYVVPGELAGRMARRLVHAHGLALPVLEHGLDFYEATAAGTARLEQGIVVRTAGIFADADSRQQVADLGTMHRRVSKRPEGVRAVEHASGKGILQAELALEPGLRLRIDQDPHAPGRHPALEALKVLRVEPETLSELEHPVHATMRGIAAGEALQG